MNLISYLKTTLKYEALEVRRESVPHLAEQVFSEQDTANTDVAYWVEANEYDRVFRELERLRASKPPTVDEIGLVRRSLLKAEAERDEADRRAGAAERELAAFKASK